MIAKESSSDGTKPSISMVGKSILGGGRTAKAERRISFVSFSKSDECRMPLRALKSSTRGGACPTVDEDVLLDHAMFHFGDTDCIDYEASMIPQGAALFREKCDLTTLASDDEFHIWESSVSESPASVSSQAIKLQEQPKQLQRSIAWAVLSDDEQQNDESTRPRALSWRIMKKAYELRKKLMCKRKTRRHACVTVPSTTTKLMQRFLGKTLRGKHVDIVQTTTEEDESCPLVTVSHMYASLDEFSSKDEVEINMVPQNTNETPERFVTNGKVGKVVYAMAETSNKNETIASTQKKLFGYNSKEVFKSPESSATIVEFDSKCEGIQQPCSKKNNNDDATTKPPLHEVSNYYRTLSSDISDVSSISGTYQMSLEYSLDSGFGARTPYLLAMSENIVRKLEQLELREAESTTLKCLVLIMDPAQRIFEIVPVPYTCTVTTIGDVLTMLPRLATDRRLAKLKFSGLSHQGIFISAPMVPIEIILDALATRKPLFAIPDKYTPKEIDEVGNSLVQTPSVAQLIKDQLEKLDRTNAVSQPRSCPILEIKNNEYAQIPRRGAGNTSQFFTRQVQGRSHVKTVHLFAV